MKRFQIPKKNSNCPLAVSDNALKINRNIKLITFLQVLCLNRITYILCLFSAMDKDFELSFCQLLPNKLYCVISLTQIDVHNILKAIKRNKFTCGIVSMSEFKVNYSPTIFIMLYR